MSTEERNRPRLAPAVFPILGTSAGPPPREGPERISGTGKLAIRRLAALSILVASAAFPAWLAVLPARPPQTRNIHIEAYRYGFSPSRIHANRGDRLRLTFSTRDTGQSFFFQDYDLHVSITPGSKLVSVHRLSRPDDPPTQMETVEIVAGLPGWRGMLISKSQFRNHTYNGPLHGTERGELIVAPNFLLYGGLGLLGGIPLAGLLLVGRRNTRGPERRWNLFQLFPWLKRASKAPWFQFNLALPMLGVFWFVILAGLLGTKVAGRNAGPMIVWVLWLSALIVILVPIGGRTWCTVCPLPLMGEWLQRSYLSRKPWRLVWPRWLSNAWPRVLLFLLLGTFSTTLVALPPATSWMLIGLTRAYPSLKPPYELLQEAYEALGQPAKAEEARQGSLASKAKVVPPLEDPLNEQLNSLCYSSTRLLKQAGVLNQLGYPDRAIEVARRAAQAEPTDPDVRHFIAHTLLASYPGQPEAIDEALTQLGECLRLKPDDPVPLWLFAQDFFGSPQPPAAVERLGAMMRPYSGRADAHLYLGRLASARGDYGEAISQYQAALKNDFNSSGVYDDLGVAMDRAARYAEAIAYFQKSVQLDPMNATAHFNLGLALLHQGNEIQGLKEAGEALRLKPDYAAAHFCLGFAFLNSKRVDAAIARFREGLRYKPDDPEGHYGLGAALSMQHKREEAITELREALRLNPNYPEASELLQQLER